jgi:ATP-dependent Clp protease ATP-binding subunit ClpC
MFSWFAKDKVTKDHVVLCSARDYARRLRHHFVSAEHILLGVLSCEGAAAEILQTYGLDRSKGWESVRAWVGEGAKPLRSGAQPPMTPRARKICASARAEAKRLSSATVGPEHFLLAILRDRENMAAQILDRYFKIALDELKQKLESRLLGA